MPLADTLLAQRERVTKAAKKGPAFNKPVFVTRDRTASVIQPIRAAVARVTGPLFPVLGGGAHVSQAPRQGHMGLDIGATQGSRVVAPVSGIVSRVQNDTGRGYGNAVWIIDPVSGEELTFGHLLNRLVEVGQRVTQGQVIGQVGSTGSSTGPHLHFEVGAPGAQPFLGQSTEQGAIDPVAWLRGATPIAGAAAGLPALAVVSPARVSSPAEAVSMFAAPAAIAPATVVAGVKPEVSVAGASGSASVTPKPAKGFFGPVLDAVNPQMKDSAASKLKGWMPRAAFVGGGWMLIFLGLIILAFSYREQITNTVAKVGGTALGAAAGNPAAIAGGVAEVVAAA